MGTGSLVSVDSDPIEYSFTALFSSSPESWAGNILECPWWGEWGGNRMLTQKKLARKVPEELTLTSTVSGLLDCGLSS